MTRQSIYNHYKNPSNTPVLSITVTNEQPTEISELTVLSVDEQIKQVVSSQPVGRRTIERISEKKKMVKPTSKDWVALHGDDTQDHQQKWLHKKQVKEKGKEEEEKEIYFNALTR
jgi:hypothetical protein